MEAGNNWTNHGCFEGYLSCHDDGLDMNSKIFDGIEVEGFWRKGFDFWWL